MPFMNASPPPSPPSPIDLEHIRERLAARYGILVSADDPIMAAVALNDIVLESHFARIDAALQRHAKTLAEVDEQRQTKQRELAKHIVGDALRHARNALNREAAHHVTTLRQTTGSSRALPCHGRWKLIAAMLGFSTLVGWGALILVVFQ